jgi:hypothetical protein
MVLTCAAATKTSTRDRTVGLPLKGQSSVEEIIGTTEKRRIRRFIVELTSGLTDSGRSRNLTRAGMDRSASGKCHIPTHESMRRMR